MRCPPPGTFLMATGWPSSRWSGIAICRASASNPPPGGKGRISSMGLLGNPPAVFATGAGIDGAPVAAAGDETGDATGDEAGDATGAAAGDAAGAAAGEAAAGAAAFGADV